MDKPQQLPPPTDPDFRNALRRRREELGLTPHQLAKRADVAVVMPKRWEDPDHDYATLPNQTSWAKLNAVLYPSEENKVVLQKPDSKLHGVTSEELAMELERRGWTVTLQRKA